MNIAKVMKSDLKKFKPEDLPLVDEIKGILNNPDDGRFNVLTVLKDGRLYPKYRYPCLWGNYYAGRYQ
jgi:hypothetical protein